MKKAQLFYLSVEIKQCAGRRATRKVAELREEKYIPHIDALTKVVRSLKVATVDKPPTQALRLTPLLLQWLPKDLCHSKL